MQNFILASLCSQTDWFGSYSVRNPQERFSRGMYIITYLNQKDPVWTPSVWNVIIDHVDLDKHGAYQTRHCSHTKSVEGNFWYSIMHDQQSNVPTHSEKSLSWMLRNQLFLSQIFRILELITFFLLRYHLILNLSNLFLIFADLFIFLLSFSIFHCVM